MRESESDSTDADADAWTDRQGKNKAWIFPLASCHIEKQEWVKKINKIGHFILDDNWH